MGKIEVKNLEEATSERTEADRLFTGILLGTMISLPLNVAFSFLGRSSTAIASQGISSKFRPVSDILGKVRRDGKYYSLKSFITPNEPLIQELASVLYQGGNFIQDAQDFVHSVITYKRERGDFWQTPIETLMDKGIGDCEDHALLFCSIARNFISPENVYCVAGEWGNGHCWVVTGDPDWHIIESTASSKKPVKENGYKPQVFFNDQYAWAGPSDFDFLLIGQRYYFEVLP